VWMGYLGHPPPLGTLKSWTWRRTRRSHTDRGPQV